MRIRLLLAVCVCGSSVVFNGQAHDVRPAYLELRESAPNTYDVLWKVPALGDNLRTPVELQLPPEAQWLSEPHGFFRNGAYIERWKVRFGGGLAGKEIMLKGLPETGIDALARVEHVGGLTQTARLLASAPSFRAEAVPSPWAVSQTYLGLGIEHILLGVDHLLFVLALVLLVKGWRRLVGTITAFTLAHSVTLAAATLGFVHVPGPPVEACIALSIVFVAAEIVDGREGRPGLTERAPWIVAFTFGLLHGLGFAGALSEVGLPPQAIPLALLFFNVGVEVGQLIFIGVVLGLGATTRRLTLTAPNWGWRVLPYTIGAVAMFWVIQRTMRF